MNRLSLGGLPLNDWLASFPEACASDLGGPGDVMPHCDPSPVVIDKMPAEFRQSLRSHAQRLGLLRPTCTSNTHTISFSPPICVLIHSSRYPMALRAAPSRLSAVLRNARPAIAQSH